MNGIILSPRMVEKDFELTAQKESEAKLYHPDIPQICFRVWVPDMQNGAAPAGYTMTTFRIKGQIIALGIDCQSVAAESKYSKVEVGDIEASCRNQTIEPLLVKMLQPFRWKRNLARCIKEKKKLTNLLTHLYQNAPKWKGQANPRLYVPETREIPYAFEYVQRGSFWMHYTYFHLEEIQSLALNLETGEISTLVKFDQKLGERIGLFTPLFEQNVGLINFTEFILQKDKNECVYAAKHALYDYNLLNCDRELSLRQKTKIALQLLQGLDLLEREEIVQCNIGPQTIYLRFLGPEAKEIEAALGSFEDAHFRGKLPATPMKGGKWPYSVPPECGSDTALFKLKFPYAIALYQLGHWLKILYGKEKPSSIAQILDSMTDPDPKKRGTAQSAHKAFCNALCTPTESKE